MYDPGTANFIFCWILYLTKDIVRIQHHILFMDKLEEPFSEQNLYTYLPEREIIGEDGEKISEWDLEIENFRDFLKS